MIYLADGKAAMKTIARLSTQIAQLQDDLARVRANLATAERHLDQSRAVALMEANEKLLIAALNADNVAEVAQSNFDKLAKVSHRDALTGTPNRLILIDRLERAISWARRNGTMVGIFFIDIDHFKQINDSYGHAAGDEALQLVAHRLQTVVRDSDTVSRYGGDEFVVLSPHVPDRRAATQIGNKLQNAFSQPSFIQGRHVQLSVSLGIATHPEDGAEPAALLAAADRAMYSGRRQRRGS